MNKKANMGLYLGWTIVIILLIVVFLALNNNNQWIDFGGSPAGQLQDQIGSINVNVQVDNPETTTPSSSTPTNEFNLCTAYTQNYPTYFTVKEYQCGLAGGDWICTDSKAGCFDITTWDYTYGCTSDANVQALKAACSLWNGDWTCTATAVGCQI